MCSVPHQHQTKLSGSQMIAPGRDRLESAHPAPEYSLSHARDKTVACQLRSTQSTTVHQQTRKQASKHARTHACPPQSRQCVSVCVWMMCVRNATTCADTAAKGGAAVSVEPRLSPDTEQQRLYCPHVHTAGIGALPREPQPRSVNATNEQQQYHKRKLGVDDMRATRRVAP